MFVVTVSDLFTDHLVTKMMDDWHHVIRWARQHSVDGCAVIRDQRIDKEYWITDISNPKLDWMYV